MDYEEMFGESENIPNQETPPTALWSLTVVLQGMLGLRELIDRYLEDPETHAYKYVSFSGCSFSWSKLKENPKVAEFDKQRIEKLVNFYLAASECIDKAIENKEKEKNVIFSKQYLDIIIKESIELWLEEIHRQEYHLKLKSLDGSMLDKYIKFILDYRESQFTRDIPPFFKDICDKYLGDK